ncbi:MAG: DUF4249 domain-containing protein, partial [Flavisolibacter sp.]|nr:DUF4249 domain-containing protein [Flavisolibacter sp.]
CKEEYDFPLRSNDVSLLVVEGVLNAGNGPTQILLSRTMKLDEVVQFKPVLQAQLTVEGKDNTSKPLSSAGNGNYTNPNLGMTIGTEYRLRIKTTDGKEYLSEWLVARNTPEIDSVTWKRTPAGLTVFNHTHDPSNNSRYYKWDYDETWQINSVFPSDYVWVSGSTIIQGSLPSSCWKYGKASTIIIGSSAQLQSDVITELPAFFIADKSEKISVRYSVLMKQQTLSKKAYEYFSLMKKNTESLGTIFDPQPSELRGNIVNIADPSEIVIGYMNAAKVTQKRIFITAQQANWSYPQNCSNILIPNHPDTIRKYVPIYLPWGAVETGPGTVTDYYLSEPHCVDCTRRGGSPTKPSYW